MRKWRWLGGVFVIFISFYIPIYLENSRNEGFGAGYEDRMEILNRRNMQNAVQKDYYEGSELAKTYCVACHSYTPPNMLDRGSWSRVLHIMETEMKKIGMEVPFDDWIKIQQFYLAYSPSDFLPGSIKAKPKVQTLFKESEVLNPSSGFMRATMLAYIDQDSSIYIGDKFGSLSRLYTDTLQPAFFIPNTPVDLQKKGHSLFVLGIGSLKPSEKPLGQLLRIDSDQQHEVLIDSLKRPVDFQILDLNHDQEDEYLIASFGSTLGPVASGKLSYFDATQEEVLIENLVGAIQVAYIDIDGDGQQEVLGLFSQARESLHIFRSMGNGKFSRSDSISFSPLYGTNSFDVADVNHDGRKDIIFTHGDNDDYSKVFKPYHGVSIYLNDPELGFTEKYFYPINGASKVKFADFDQDGDMDFVVLAMYPDLFSRPWETLLLFENINHQDFRPHYFEESPSANWMLMEVADVDQDGDQDIITAPNLEISSEIPVQLREDWNEKALAAKVYYNQSK